MDDRLSHFPQTHARAVAFAPPHEGAPPSDTAMIAAALRLIEAIKRAAALCGTAPLARLSEDAAALLDRLRSGTPATPEAVALIAATIDRIRVVLDGLDARQAMDGDAAERDAETPAANGPVEGPAVPPQQDRARPRPSLTCQPFGIAVAGLADAVHDLAKTLGKKIAVVVEDGDVELDAAVIGALHDPLVQLVRFCADRGLETPDVRLAAGKTWQGTVRVAASNGPEGILIEVGDDGRGLDLARIGANALRRGLLDQTALAGMTADDLAQLVFSPGILEAGPVDLHVVRSAIEAAGGTMSVTSGTGNGTRFAIRLSPALYLVPGLIVVAGGQRFALLQGDGAEVCAIGPGARRRLEWLGNLPLLTVGKTVIPALDLGAALGLDGGDSRDDHGMAVVVRSGGASFGLLLSTVEDLHMLAVKPIASPGANPSIFAGETVLEDGDTLGVLDPGSLARLLSPPCNDNRRRLSPPRRRARSSSRPGGRQHGERA